MRIALIVYISFTGFIMAYAAWSLAESWNKADRIGSVLAMSFTVYAVILVLLIALEVY